MGSRPNRGNAPSEAIDTATPNKGWIASIFIPGARQREPGISRENFWIPGSPAQARVRPGKTVRE
jgi:hypothetical protein